MYLKIPKNEHSEGLDKIIKILFLGWKEYKNQMENLIIIIKKQKKQHGQNLKKEVSDLKEK